MRTGAGFTGYEGEVPASGIPSTPLRKGTMPIMWSAATRLIESLPGGSCECLTVHMRDEYPVHFTGLIPESLLWLVGELSKRAFSTIDHCAIVHVNALEDWN